MDNVELKNISNEMPIDLENFRMMCENGTATEEVVVDILKKQIKVMMFKIVQNLYYIMKDHPINRSRSMLNGCLPDPETLRDYYSNMVAMNKSASKIRKDMNNNMDNLKNSLGNTFLEYKKSADSFAGYLSGALEFTGCAVTLIEQGEVKNNKAYIKLLTQNLNYMTAALEKSSRYISCWENFGDDYVSMFDLIQVFFAESSDLIKKMIDEIKRDNQREKARLIEEQKPVEPARVVKMEQDEKTKARLGAIKAANDLYDRFQVDFMRDLEKEISMMNRDMYEKLIDKVEQFLKRFPMPLSNDVSLGMAIEAQSQINKFIDAVYEISRNTYSPVVFGG